MGYVCPVCEDPQADGEHLANHLAFTAMLGDDEHEAWLDENAPGWADTDPSELAPRVTDEAEETEFPQVFEDTTDGADHGHDRAHGGSVHGHGRSQGHGHSRGQSQDPLDGVSPADVGDPSDLFAGEESGRAPEDVIAEARELTREQWANAAAEDGEGDDADDADTAEEDRSAGGDDAAPE